MIIIFFACEYDKNPAILDEPLCICDTSVYQDCDCDSDQPIRCDCDTSEFKDCDCDTDPMRGCDCDVTIYRDCGCDTLDPYYFCPCDTSQYDDCECDMDTIPLPISFSKRINPILSNKCGDCHFFYNEDIAYEEMIAEGTVDTKNPLNSKMVVFLKVGFMPPYPYPTLTGKELEDLIRWIEEGAQNN